MKRQDLLRHLRRNDCFLVREGANIPSGVTFTTIDGPQCLGILRLTITWRERSAGTWKSQNLEIFKLRTNFNPHHRPTIETPSMPVAHENLGEYLAEHDPVQALWHHLAELVAQDESRPIPTQEFSQAAGTIYLVGLFEGEIVQGGFRQFLTNPSGNYARETLTALQAVGAHVCAELLEKAMAPFPGGIAPVDHDSRLSMLAQLEASDPKNLATFDELYMQHVDAQSPHRVENLTTLLLDYLKENASESVTG